MTEEQPRTPIVPGIVFCTVIVGGYWVVVVISQILSFRVWVEVDVGDSSLRCQLAER